MAEWDGTAWTGSTHYTTNAPVLPGPPKPFAFLRQSWVWWMVAGQALVIPPAVVTGLTGSAFWSWLSATGYVAFLIGTVLMMVRYLPVGRLSGLRSLTFIGIGGGILGFAIAFGLESVVEHHFGLSTVLWSTGPIEEGAKLLVPFALLAFGSARFKDPLAGFYLVLVSGATTGAVEGVEWEARAHHTWFHLQLALVRPAAELPHVFVTGFAGAVIWLAAWRRGRAMTWAGTAAFAIAVGIHSLHDGFITLFGVSPQPAPSSIAQTAGQAVGKGLAGGLFALGIGIASFLLGRHGARELSPPSAVAGAPPPWRPQIKTWGAVEPVRVEAPVPVGIWNPYGTNGYAAYGGYPGYVQPNGYGGYGGYPGYAQPNGYAVYGGYPGYAQPNGFGGYAPPVGNGSDAPPVGYGSQAIPSTPPPTLAPAPAPAPPPPPPLPAPVAPVPVAPVTIAPVPTLVATETPLAVPSLGVPTVARAGWYPYGDGSGRTAWWDGSAWSAPLRWDGITWRQD